jgi:hypothetical protein
VDLGYPDAVLADKSERQEARNSPRSYVDVRPDACIMYDAQIARAQQDRSGGTRDSRSQLANCSLASTIGLLRTSMRSILKRRQGVREGGDDPSLI